MSSVPASLILSFLFAVNSVCARVDGTSQTLSKRSNHHVPRKDAFWGIHFDLHPGAQDTILGRDVRSENIGAFLDRVKPDFVQYDCKGHPGYTGYPSKVGYPSPGIVKDALAVWRDETRKRGIGLFIHYSGVWDSVAIQHHPEWAVTQADGSKDPDATSVFGDYAAKLMIPQLKEVTSKYDLDGVWVDGECWAARFDYGTTAALRWKDFAGTETLPRKSTDPLWQEWKTFQREAFENYLINWIDELHKFRPDLELTSNWSYTPHMPVPIKAKVDFLSGDFSAKESVDRARFEARYLASTGKPWDLMAWGFNGYSTGFNGARQMKTAEQLKQEVAVVLAVGGGVQVYYQPTRGGYVSRYITNTAGAVADFCRERQATTHKSETVPQIALLLSSASYLHRNDNLYSPGGQYNALEGALHLLLESGYSVDLMSEHQLEDCLAKYPVVAVAQASVVDPAFHQKLVEYTKAGGVLLFLDAESALPFKDVLGVSLSSDLKNVEAYVGNINGLAPVPGLWQSVDPATAAVLGYRTMADGEINDENDSDAFGYVEMPRDVAATSVTLGEGTVIAFYGPVSQAYFDTHNANLRHWVSDIVALAFASPIAHLEDMPCIDMSLRRLQDGREVVQLVNLTNAQRANRFATVESIPPSGTGILIWRTKKLPTSVKAYPGGENINIMTEPDGDEGYISRIPVNNVPIHKAFIVEFAL